MTVGSAMRDLRVEPVSRVDALTATAATLTAVLLLMAAREAGARQADLLGVVMLVLAGVPLLFRARWPVAAFGATMAVVLGYLALDYPGGAELPLILLGLYGVSSAGRRRWAAALAGVFVGGGSAYRLLVEGEDPLIVTVGGALLLLTALWGDSVHARRRLRAETAQRLQAAEAEKESVARARVAEERLRIARELHDVMAHTITTMSVQAGAAADLLEHRAHRAVEPLEAMRRSAREARTELRAVIRLLRETGQEATRAPQPRLDQLDDLVASVQDTGLHVDLVVEGAPAHPASAALDLTSYRIIQEGLTNVIRHAAATHADVRLSYEATHLRIQVSDDGHGDELSRGSEGHGLQGLRERAYALGGSLEAGSRAEGGFRIQAVLPLEATA